MPPDWLRIKQARPDLTDYVMHSTRAGKVDSAWQESFEVLKLIIRDGFLTASFAPRESITAGTNNNTIRGPHPAVCFTEQPLAAFLTSCKTLSTRYRRYAIGVRQACLYQYGGRPVIYGDEKLLDTLPDSYKHLWVRFSPIPNGDFGGYPIDWTHEREWRVRPAAFAYGGSLGESPSEGVPLLLPPTEDFLCLPWILVKQKSEAEELKQWIAELSPYSGSNEVLKCYFENLSKAPVVPLDEVEGHLSNGDKRWARLDTLPLEELDPTASKTFTRVGWRKLQ